MLGFSRKQMLERVEDILKFSELEEYCLHPLKGLSSGMVARLGFAIATNVKPDILILDEVLSVGDQQFRQKCQERLAHLWNAEAAILVVSHDLEFIQRSCDKVVYLSQGQVKYIGSPQKTVSQYLDSISK
jgi:ABC-type polysaccharide/polyol phosphate transport system ATPase subunit